MCRAHATVRGFIGEIVARDDPRDILVDMEAGLEHLARGTGRYLSRFVAVIEPYFRSMETGRRVATLAHELGVADVLVVANKVRDDEDRAAIADFCTTHALHLAAEVPFDPELIRAERVGAAPIEHAPDAPAVAAIARLAGIITANGST